MTYEDARNWLEKNVDPTRYKTREELMDAIGRLEGFSGADGKFENKVINPFGKSQPFIFNSQEDLKKFEKKQIDSIKDIEKAESQEDMLKAMKKQREELDAQIKQYDSFKAPKSRVSRPKVAVKPQPILERTVKAVGGFFKRIFGRK